MLTLPNMTYQTQLSNAREICVFQVLVLTFFEVTAYSPTPCKPVRGDHSELAHVLSV